MILFSQTTKTLSIIAVKKVKSSILLTCKRDQGREIYNTFALNNDDKLKFDLILKKFDEYCSPRKNITLTRYKFLTYKQKEGQTFNEFLTQLRKFSSDCEFGELRESLIRDMIVIGVLDENVRERLLRDSDLTLKRAIEIGHSFEQRKQHSELLRNESKILAINKSSQHKRNHRQQGYSDNPYQVQAQGGKMWGIMCSKNVSTVGCLM